MTVPRLAFLPERLSSRESRASSDFCASVGLSPPASRIRGIHIPSAFVKRLLADPISFVRKSRGVEEATENYSLERPEHESLPAGHPDADDLPRVA